MSFGLFKSKEVSDYEEKRDNMLLNLFNTATKEDGNADRKPSVVITSPERYSEVDALRFSDPPSIYDTTSWEDTEEGKAALAALNTAEDELGAFGEYKYGNQKELDSIMQSILNRKPFSYNFNEDAFYQMYKDKFTQQGKMAAADVMGKAAAMTGGFGNSYAATVGNQAYLAELGNLNDIIPELYQLAYDKYTKEGQDLRSKYELLEGDYQKGYSEHEAERDRLEAAVKAARSDFLDGGELYYSNQKNANDAASKETDDALKLLQLEEDNKYKRERDAIEDEKWLKEFEAKYKNGDEDSDKSDVIKLIRSFAGKFDDNATLAKFLDGLIEDGTLTTDEATDLFEEFMYPEE